MLHHAIKNFSWAAVTAAVGLTLIVAGCFEQSPDTVDGRDLRQDDSSDQDEGSDAETVTGTAVDSDSGSGTALETDPATSPSTSDDGDTDTVDPEGFPFESIKVVWEPCSFEAGADDGQGECAVTQMPLYWEKPDGRTLPVAVKRRLGDGTSNAKLWFLHGGPGASGTEDLPRMMERYQALDPGLDVYTIDHRGVGLSGRLGCPDQESPGSAEGEAIVSWEWEECIEHLVETYGEDLAAYSTSQSAIDVAAYIHATAEPGKKVFVWGGSYGSYLLHRYLLIFPDGADGAVLEGIAPPDASFIYYEESFDKVGEALLEVCGADVFCSEMLGPDPLARARDILAGLEDGACASLGQYSYYATVLPYYLLYYFPYHDAVPAYLYRMERCGGDDVRAFYNLLSALFGREGIFTRESPGQSTVLHHNIVYSEMYEHPDWPTEESLYDYFEQVGENSLFSMGQGASLYEEYLAWPKYEDARWDDRWAVTQTPMLMLQGMLDPATPYEKAKRLEEHFDGEHQYFAAFPTAAHNVASGTPVSRDEGAVECGAQLFSAFLKDPENLDMSCMAEVLPNNFLGDLELAQTLFGTDDLWDLEPADKEPRAPQTVSLSPTAAAALRSLRLHIRNDFARLGIPLPDMAEVELRLEQLQREGARRQDPSRSPVK